MKRIYEYTDHQGDRILVDVSGNDTLILVHSKGEAGRNVLLPRSELLRLVMRLGSVVEYDGCGDADVHEICGAMMNGVTCQMPPSHDGNHLAPHDDLSKPAEVWPREHRCRVIRDDGDRCYLDTGHAGRCVFEDALAAPVHGLCVGEALLRVVDFIGYVEASETPDDEQFAAVGEAVDVLRSVVEREGGGGADVPAPAVPMEGEPGPGVLGCDPTRASIDIAKAIADDISVRSGWWDGFDPMVQNEILADWARIIEGPKPSRWLPPNAIDTHAPAPSEDE